MTRPTAKGIPPAEKPRTDSREAMLMRQLAFQQHKSNQQQEESGETLKTVLKWVVVIAILFIVFVVII